MPKGRVKLLKVLLHYATVPFPLHVSGVCGPWSRFWKKEESAKPPLFSRALYSSACLNVGGQREDRR